MGLLLTEGGLSALLTEAEGATLYSACQLMAAVEDITCECVDVTDAEKRELISQASDIVAILTGGKITGVCEDTIRPCSERACGYGFGCSCCKLSGIDLMGPYPHVLEVKVDGEVLDPSEYVLVDGRNLVRRHGRWPGCQDPLASDEDDGTFSIRYRHGVLPLLAKQAVIEIVCDFIQSEPAQQLRKPMSPNTRSVNVAGVNIQFEHQMEEWKRRMLMLPKLVRLMAVYAPDGPDAAFVYSPELRDGWTLYRVT